MRPRTPTLDQNLLSLPCSGQAIGHPPWGKGCGRWYDQPRQMVGRGVFVIEPLAHEQDRSSSESLGSIVSLPAGVGVKDGINFY